MKKFWGPDFVGLSDDFHGLSVLCGPSANVELTVEAELPVSPTGSYVLGEKNLVADIRVSTSRYRHLRFTVTSLTGEVIHIDTTGKEELPAGSSVNVAFALQEWNGKVGIFAPLGQGPGGKFMRDSFEERGCGYALIRASDTARTLTVRTIGGGPSTLFCVKPEYRASHRVRRYLRGTSPDVLVASGVKPADLHLIQPLFARRVGQARAFTPHKELLRSAKHRPELLAMLHDCDLLQVNAHEASLLLQDEVTPENVERQIRRFASLGVLYPVITMGGAGACLKRNGTGTIVRQDIVLTREVDPCGAGDSHLAALCYCLLLRKIDLQTSLWAAANVAAKVVSEVGPWTGLPTLTEMEAILRSSPSRPALALPPP